MAICTFERFDDFKFEFYEIENYLRESKSLRTLLLITISSDCKKIKTTNCITKSCKILSNEIEISFSYNYFVLIQKFTIDIRYVSNQTFILLN